MINFLNKKIFTLFLLIGFILVSHLTYAEDSLDYNAENLLPKAEIFINPSNAEFLVGSTFDVPIYIDTKGNSINTVNVKLSFDATRLSIVKPSGGKSILGIWLEPPSYDNKKGTASFMGVVPKGIVTSSGLIATVTFKAIATGNSSIGFSNYSSANLNDGIGSNVILSLGRAIYKINPKIPEGVMIYSGTHPFQDRWYNNSSPFLSWDNVEGLNGFNYLLDSNPNTIPSTEIKDSNTFISYENLKDGIWYFHVRSNINGIWGNTSHFQIKVDTNPPAFFPTIVDKLKDGISSKKYLVSFMTTDALSGLNHYEVGVLDKSDSEVSSPVFIQSESPYLISNSEKNTRVMIRAFDNAGNMREVSADIYPGVTLVIALKKYALYLFMLITFMLILELILHYLFGHHILNHIKRMFYIFGKISSDEKYKEIEKEIEKIDNNDSQ